MTGTGVGSDLINLIAFLFPGFAGILVFKALTETKELSRIDMSIYAVFLTFLGNVISAFLFDVPISISNLSDISNIDWMNMKFNPISTLIATGTAIVIAIIVSQMVVHGIIYKILGGLKLTKKTGRISVWHDVFSDYRGVWIEVIFLDGKRLVGWPQYYSSGDKQYEIFLANATWAFPEKIVEAVSESPDSGSANSDESENSEYSPEFTYADVPGPGVYINSLDNVLAINVLKGE